jgi:hypothetical protein
MLYHAFAIGIRKRRMEDWGPKTNEDVGLKGEEVAN